MRRSRLSILALIALIVTAGAFNIGKAVHVDDTAYLELARGVLHDPLRPMSTWINWGGAPAPAYVSINQPPLFYYVLASIMRIFGESDLALHACMAVISALTIVLFERTARRAAPESALAVTALFALSPAFLPAQNLMTDVPLALAWIVGFGSLLSAGAAEAHRARRYATDGAAIAAACLIKYPSLALVPAMAGVIAFRRHWRFAWTVAIPVGALCLWSLWNYAEFGGMHLFSRPTIFQPIEIASRSIEWVACLGVAAPIGLLLFARRRWGRPAVAWTAPAVCGAAMFVAERYYAPREFQSAVLWGVFTCAGLAGVIAILAAASDRWRAGDQAGRDRVLALTLWAAAGAFVIVLAPFMAMRHVLLALPPVLLLAGQSIAALRLSRLVVAGAVALTGVMGCAIAAADYAYADVYRHYAQVIGQAMPHDGSRVWSLGHWGWQWYTEKAGWLQFDEQHVDLRAGDTVVVPSVIASQTLPSEQMDRLLVVGRYWVSARGATILRTYRRNPWGGYYATFWRTGSFPFSFTYTPVEMFTVFRVER